MDIKKVNDFEITWRKELIKRLQSPMNTLTRKYEKEQAQKQKRVEELRQYSSSEEAHEAYGYAYITLDEYEQICKDFENVEKILSPVAAAREELRTIISRLKEDVRYFEWEKLSDSEKREIEKSNEIYRNNIRAEKGGSYDS